MHTYTRLMMKRGAFGMKPVSLNFIPRFHISNDTSLPKDPYLILSVDRDMDLKEIK